MLEEFSYLSNVKIFLVTDEFLVAAKALALISVHRSYKNKEKDKNDAISLLNKIDINKVLEIITV